MRSIDWKLPIIIFFAYTIFCIIFEYFFKVPGSISLKAITVFSLPYMGSSLAILFCKTKNLVLQLNIRKGNKIDIKFHRRILILLVPILLLLQIISWFYILTKANQIIEPGGFFNYLRVSAVTMSNIVPTFLSYPNGLCFASFCIALAGYRVNKKSTELVFLALSILIIFLNDLQSAARAGMAFAVFILLISTIWDWRVNRVNPVPLLLPILGISVITQLPKILREGFQYGDKINSLVIEVMRYCFSYLNTLTDLLTRLPEPNWIGERSFLPIFNLASKLDTSITRSAIHSIENSIVWGYNNYTISGEILRDFSYPGCLILPFFISLIMIYFAGNSSQVLNISITCFFCGWLVFGCITNILIMGGFFISIAFLFSLVCLEKILAKKNSLHSSH